MITQGMFCYWDCKSGWDAVIMGSYTIFTCIIILYAFRFYQTYKKIDSVLGTKSKQISNKLLGIITWGLLEIVATLYSFIVYFIFYYLKQPENIPDITIYSQFYALFDTFPAVFTQTLLLLTAKTMVTNSLGYLLSEQQHQPTKKERIIYKFILRYEKARVLFVIIWISVVFPFQNVWAFQIITQIKILFIMIDCALIIGLLYFSHKFMQKYSNLLFKGSYTQKQLLQKQTSRLVICAGCRLIVDCIFYIIFPFVFKQLEDELNCIEKFQKHLQFSIGYLLIGTFLMHHLTMLILLKIYNPGNYYSNSIVWKKEEHLNQSSIEQD